MRRLAAFLVIAAAAAIVGVAVGIALRDGGGGVVAADGSPRPQDPVIVRTSFEPNGHLFGTPVVAVVDVRVDSSVVDPASLRLEPSFEPYEVSGSRTVEQVEHGGLTRLTYRYSLRCLREGCEPLEDRGEVQLEPSRVSYRWIGDSRRGGEMLEWQPFVVTGRVADRAVVDIAWRADETALAAVDYRARPGATSLVLLVLAALLAAGAAALGWRLWGGRPESETGAEGETRTPLAVVLEAARAAAANGDLPGRRRALESVAVELGHVGLDDLAVEARTLAWSPREATGADVEELARRSELAVEGTA